MMFENLTFFAGYTDLALHLVPVLTFLNYFRSHRLESNAITTLVAVSTLLLPQNMISTVAIGLWVMVIT